VHAAVLLCQHQLDTTFNVHLGNANHVGEAIVSGPVFTPCFTTAWLYQALVQQEPQTDPEQTIGPNLVDQQ